MDQQPNDYRNHSKFEPQSTPVWRILLSIVLAIMAIGRLAYTCSGAKQSNQNQQNAEFQQIMEEHQTRYEDRRRDQLSEAERLSNEVMYNDYQNLDNLTTEQNAAYKISKIKNDSVILFDLSTKITIQKKSFFQKSFDDSLRMAIKTPQNMTIFVHSFEGQGDLKYNFIELKKKRQLSNLQVEEKLGSANTYSYTINQNNKIFNGYALAVKGDGHFFFIEMESDKIKKQLLKQKALEYLVANLKKAE